MIQRFERDLRSWSFANMKVWPEQCVAVFLHFKIAFFVEQIISLVMHPPLMYANQLTSLPAFFLLLTANQIVASCLQSRLP